MSRRAGIASLIEESIRRAREGCVKVQSRRRNVSAIDARKQAVRELVERIGDGR